MEAQYQNIEETYLLPINSNSGIIIQEVCTSNINSSNKNNTIPDTQEKHTFTMERCRNNSDKIFLGIMLLLIRSFG
jgi:hypothetical protein